MQFVLRNVEGGDVVSEKWNGKIKKKEILTRVTVFKIGCEPIYILLFILSF